MKIFVILLPLLVLSSCENVEHPVSPSLSSSPLPPTLTPEGKGVLHIYGFNKQNGKSLQDDIPNNSQPKSVAQSENLTPEGKGVLHIYGFNKQNGKSLQDDKTNNSQPQSVAEVIQEGANARFERHSDYEKSYSKETTSEHPEDLIPEEKGLLHVLGFNEQNGKSLLDDITNLWRSEDDDDGFEPRKNTKKARKMMKKSRKNTKKTQKMEDSEEGEGRNLGALMSMATSMMGNGAAGSMMSMVSSLMSGAGGQDLINTVMQMFAGGAGKDIMNNVMQMISGAQGKSLFTDPLQTLSEWLTDDADDTEDTGVTESGRTLFKLLPKINKIALIQYTRKVIMGTCGNFCLKTVADAVSRVIERGIRLPSIRGILAFIRTLIFGPCVRSLIKLSLEYFPQILIWG